MSQNNIFAKFWIGDVPVEIRDQMVGQPFYDHRKGDVTKDHVRIGTVTKVELEHNNWYATVELDNQEFIKQIKDGVIKKL